MKELEAIREGRKEFCILGLKNATKKHKVKKICNSAESRKYTDERQQQHLRRIKAGYFNSDFVPIQCMGWRNGFSHDSDLLC